MYLFIYSKVSCHPKIYPTLTALRLWRLDHKTGGYKSKEQTGSVLPHLVCSREFPYCAHSTVWNCPSRLSLRYTHSREMHRCYNNLSCPDTCLEFAAWSEAYSIHDDTPAQPPPLRLLLSKARHQPSNGINDLMRLPRVLDFKVVSLLRPMGTRYGNFEQIGCAPRETAVVHE